ncbi:sigma-54-dependent Fis family transcriptional regulator, partial [Myxococcota bacterium]|nr:sigma-54-dependent Fis family transcriptional regulator [Myxococcota bacterium]
DTDVPVYIYGESGVGKELVARALHERSWRKKGPFVSVNCAAIPENLIESELFGYRRGAFTGAVRDKKGLFSVARGGTLLLDEVGDMPLAMQVKLLRVLQERSFRAVGATQDEKSDVRIISASHKKLSELVSLGEFREDLFFRLHVVDIEVPPLRERREDVIPLIEHFSMRQSGKEARKLFSEDALRHMLSWDWPGNVRELENEVVRALTLADGQVEVTDLSPRLAGASKRSETLLAQAQQGSLREILGDYEREVVLAALRRNAWNVRKTADDLGLSRAAFYTRMNKLGISRGG